MRLLCFHILFAKSGFECIILNEIFSFFLNMLRFPIDYYGKNIFLSLTPDYFLDPVRYNGAKIQLLSSPISDIAVGDNTIINALAKGWNEMQRKEGDIFPRKY